MADEKKFTDELPIDPAKPDTKSNLLMVVAIVAFLAMGGFILLSVSDDPPETVEEATEVVS